MKIKALFLCSELAGYFMNCIETLGKTVSCDILVYHLVNENRAPFEFSTNRITLRKGQGQLYSKFKRDVLDFDPDIVYVAGWISRDYHKIAREFVKKRKIVICGIDNPWTGSIRQKLLCLFSNVIIKPSFSHMWVAGRRQFQFARELKYSNEFILRGVYAADINNFVNTHKKNYRKELLFVGRFEAIKGVEELYHTFISLSTQERNGWKLRLIGSGQLEKVLKPTQDISIEPFMQPELLAEQTREAGAFILPSRKEPWGVVVHEFAASGLPLVLSEAVGAGEEYLIANYNGFVFKTGNIESLRSILIQLFLLDQDTLEIMGTRSTQLALRYTPELWTAVFLSTLRI